MHEIRSHVRQDEVDPAAVEERFNELLAQITWTVNDRSEAISPAPLVSYAGDKPGRRIERLTEADAESPPVEEPDIGESGGHRLSAWDTRLDGPAADCVVACRCQTR